MHNFFYDVIKLNCIRVFLLVTFSHTCLLVIMNYAKKYNVHTSFKLEKCVFFIVTINILVISLNKFVFKLEFQR